MAESICFLGDSISKGVMFDPVKNRYVVIKENFANRIAEYRDASVKNLSKFGSTVTDGLHRFQKQLPDLDDCQTVVIEFGGNDSDFLWTEISMRPDIHHDPKTVLSVFIQRYTQLIEAVRKSGKLPILLNLPPVDHERYFAWISRDLNADHILKWLGGSSEFIYRWHEQYNVAVHKVAGSTNTELIDIRSAFLERRDYASLLCADGIHPSEEGHALIAQAFINHEADCGRGIVYVSDPCSR